MWISRRFRRLSRVLASKSDFLSFLRNRRRTYESSFLAYSNIASSSRKRAQELIRLDNVAFAVAFVGVNNPPTPAIFCRRATISPRPTGSVKLVSDPFPIFHVASPSRRQNRFTRNDDKA